MAHASPARRPHRLGARAAAVISLVSRASGAGRRRSRSRPRTSAPSAREQPAREQRQAARDDPARTIAASYEAIVRRYPHERLLRQRPLAGRGLLRAGLRPCGDATRDRDAAAKMLQWLKREYPASSYAGSGRRRASRRWRRRGSPRHGRGERAGQAVRAPVDAPAAAPAAVPAPAPVDATPLPAAADGHHPASMSRFETSPPRRCPTGERVMLELTREVTVDVVQQSASDDRLVLNLAGRQRRRRRSSPPPPRTAAALLRTRASGSALPPTVSSSRLDLSAATAHVQHVSAATTPYRLVIDLETDGGARAGRAPPPRSAPARLPRRARAAAARAAVRDAPAIARTTAPAAGARRRRRRRHVRCRRRAPARGGYSLARQLGLGVSRIVIDPATAATTPAPRPTASPKPTRARRRPAPREAAARPARLRRRADAAHGRVRAARGTHGDRQSREGRSVPVDPCQLEPAARHARASRPTS